MNNLKVGDDVEIKDYTGMGDPKGWRIRAINGDLATIWRPDSNPNAILAFTNTVQIGLTRLQKTEKLAEVI